LNTSNPYIRAFKAGLSGFAVHPSTLQATLTVNTLNTNYLNRNPAESKVNHLTQSLNNYINRELSSRAYNSSFLNSTSITSQEATEQFLIHLQEITDFALRDINHLKVSGTIFSDAPSYYQSFNHSSANNFLQESLLTLADSINRDDSVFSDFKRSAHQLLQTYGLPIYQNSASEMLRGMSQLLNTQLSNVGHLVDIRA
jgi:hypothetical protein